MGRSSHHVKGKVSIGTPLKGPVPIEKAEGRKCARRHKDLRLRDGQPIGKGHVRRMKDKGIEEIYVYQGNAPDTLRYFQLMKRSDEYEGEFVESPDLLKKFNLKKKPQSIPVIFPVNNKDRIFVDSMRNWDARNSKMYCSSNDGKTAKRAVLDDQKNYTGEYKELDCIPFYRDDRGSICPFRDHNSRLKEKMPCKYRARLFFNILTTDASDFNLGSFYKFETASHNTGQKIDRTLDDLQEQFGKISFIPCELELDYEKRVTPEGHKTEQPTVGLSVSYDLLDKFSDTVDKVKNLISTYSLDVEIEDDTSQEAIDNEFRPQVEKQRMRDRGVIEDKDDDIYENIDPRYLDDDPTFEEKLRHIEALALQLPEDMYESFEAKSQNLTPNNVDKWIKNISDYLDNNFTEQERRQNADEKEES